MKQEIPLEITLKSADGTPLFTRTWRPEKEPAAWIVMCHGQSEHSGRYDYLGKKLVDKGFALVMPDLRGHGKSGGKRGHTIRFSRYIDDILAAVNYTLEQEPKKIILGGQSMGGLIAARIAAENPIDLSGVFLSAPALRLNFNPPVIKVIIGNVLSFFLPALTLGNELNPEDLSHKKDIVETQRADPLNHGKISTRAFTEFMSTQKEVFEMAPDYRLPLLILHGGQDKIAAISGSRDFFQSAGSPDKELKTYEGFYHEIFNETDRDTVIKDLLKWLKSHSN